MCAIFCGFRHLSVEITLLINCFVFDKHVGLVGSISSIMYCKWKVIFVFPTFMQSTRFHSFRVPREAKTYNSSCKFHLIPHTSQLSSFKFNDIIFQISSQNMEKDKVMIVALHDKPDLIEDCAKILNEEWPRSKTARFEALFTFYQLSHSC